MSAALLVALLTALPPAPGAEAERLAAHAIATASEHPDAALAEALRALSLTADFEPTAFVTAGRKGEVVEDAYLAARGEYRKHRARLYEAVGECLARKGSAVPAARYLGRAVTLDPGGSAVPRLARALVAAGRGHAALDLIGRGGLPPSVAEEIADATGAPSAQGEIDRGRLETLTAGPVAYKDGPFRPPIDAHLSTGEPFRLVDPGISLIYAADPTCRSCSADLDLVKRLIPRGVRVVLVPVNPAQDQALRQILSLYHDPWPVAVGNGIATALGLEPRSILVTARGGWSAAYLRAPFSALAATLGILGRSDVSEVVPRPAWNHRAPDRRPSPPSPGLLPDGLAPGEDEPAPEAFLRAVDSLRAARPAEALAAFVALEGKGDGWLLPPEARLNRAHCLAALGRRDEARQLLLRTGDSRFQSAVDEALESVGSLAKSRP